MNLDASQKLANTEMHFKLKSTVEHPRGGQIVSISCFSTLLINTLPEPY